MLDAWGKLYDITSGCDAGIALTDRPDIVILKCKDGSKAVLTWDNGGWRFDAQLNACPGDIAAKDSL